ncbi:hypothetical protein TNCT_404381 [Trichonephila clavata]|uniref:Uncharacterized protein n=1 Tax=Trichonephila clavata TaxID=2740835 RepID=A0A8X6HC01_TRICU|nr:hypothetical protein TNCT_404381 [Trichonephila clavata]
MDPFETGNCQGRSFEKSLSKAGPLLGSQCPDLISRATRHPATVPFIQQSCVLMCHWTTEDLSDNNAVFKSWTQWNGFQQCMSLLNNASTCPWTQDTFSEQKCIHPHNKTVFKLSMNILRTLTTQASIRQAVLETSRGHPYTLGDTEKSIFTLSPPPWISFSSSPARHVSLYKACFKPVNGPPKTFQDAMDPLRNKETVKDAHSKSLY